jgi:hypothetical protein
MPRSIKPRRRSFGAAAAILFAIGTASLSQRDAASEPIVADGAPSGMVAFVANGVCPPGWVHSFELEGRILVGTVDKAEIGETVGTPFADREVRVHHHDYVGTIDLPKKNIAGANGGNESGASWGTYSVMGTTTDSESGLPFIQMEGCVKP